MKKIVTIIFITSSITSCSTSNPPLVQKLSQDIQEVTTFTAVSAISRSTLTAPKNSQSIVTIGVFKVDDNIYNGMDKLLIPRGAIITGLYTNDGLRCEIHWVAIYSNLNQYKNQIGSLKISQLTSQSNCRPEYGVKSGERVTISFTADIND